MNTELLPLSFFILFLSIRYDMLETMATCALVILFCLIFLFCAWLIVRIYRCLKPVPQVDIEAAMDTEL